METFENLAYKIEAVAGEKSPRLVAKGKEIDLLIKHKSWGAAENQNLQFAHISRQLPNQDGVETVRINAMFTSLNQYA